MSKHKNPHKAPTKKHQAKNADQASQQASADALARIKDELAKVSKLTGEALTGKADLNEVANMAREKALEAMKLKHYKEAIPIYRYLLQLTPEDTNSWVNLGVACRASGAYHAAIGAYRKAIMLSNGTNESNEIKNEVNNKVNKPDASLLSNMANCWKDLGYYDKAVTLAEQAAEQDGSPGIVNNYAIALRQAGRVQEAFAVFSRLADRYPENPAFQWDRAYTQMYLSMDEKSWQDFESRWQGGLLPEHPLADKVAAWNGESLAGKSLLLTREQGFGDTLLMTRYLPELKQAGADIYLECRKELWPLLAGCGVHLVEDPVHAAADDTADQSSQNLPAYDYRCPIMTLPRLLGTNEDNIPEPVAFTIPEEIQQNIAIKNDGAALNVGVVWSGSETFGGNKHRSTSLENFLKLALDIDDVRMVSLQKGPQAQLLAQTGTDTLITDLSAHLQDFAITAAIVEKLDVIVMTDSAVAHLAGTMGKPVINLLNTMPYWLYRTTGTTTPWYPSMRLIRQREAMDWTEVFDQVRDILTELSKVKLQQGGLSASSCLQLIDQQLASAIKDSETEEALLDRAVVNASSSGNLHH